MGWMETCAMEERFRFVELAERQEEGFAVVCRRFGVSRKTGYKWVNRFDEGGAGALEDRPRAPRRCPHRTPERLRAAILELRRRHPTWGPRKLLAWLHKRWPVEAWPVASTVGDLLHREGLVQQRKSRRRARMQPPREEVSPREANDLWTVDFYSSACSARRACPEPFSRTTARPSSLRGGCWG